MYNIQDVMTQKFGFSASLLKMPAIWDASFCWLVNISEVSSDHIAFVFRIKELVIVYRPTWRNIAKDSIFQIFINLFGLGEIKTSKCFFFFAIKQLHRFMVKGYDEPNNCLRTVKLEE